jgi:hypothetical protein
MIVRSLFAQLPINHGWPLSLPLPFVRRTQTPRPNRIFFDATWQGNTLWQQILFMLRLVVLLLRRLLPHTDRQTCRQSTNEEKSHDGLERLLLACHQFDLFACFTLHCQQTLCRKRSSSSQEANFLIAFDQSKSKCVCFLFISIRTFVSFDVVRLVRFVFLSVVQLSLSLARPLSSLSLSLSLSFPPSHFGRLVVCNQHDSSTLLHNLN